MNTIILRLIALISIVLFVLPGCRRVVGDAEAAPVAVNEPDASTNPPDDVMQGEDGMPTAAAPEEPAAPEVAPVAQTDPDAGTEPPGDVVPQEDGMPN